MGEAWESMVTPWESMGGAWESMGTPWESMGYLPEYQMKRHLSASGKFTTETLRHGSIYFISDRYPLFYKF